MIELVTEFHRRFKLPIGESDVLSTDERAQQFRVKFLEEEINELQTALASGDRVGVFDALLDIVYVAQGTALFAGIDSKQWNAGMAAVHAANTGKVRVESAGSSKRGSSFDVRKPEGWVGPEETLKEILSWKK